MKKVIRLTESDLMRIVRRVISEQSIGGPDAKYVSSLKSGNSGDKELLTRACQSWTGGALKDIDKQKIDSWTKKQTGTNYPVDMRQICKDQNSSLINLTNSQRKVLKGVIDLSWM